MKQYKSSMDLPRFNVKRDGICECDPEDFWVQTYLRRGWLVEVKNAPVVQDQDGDVDAPKRRGRKPKKAE